MNKQLSVLSDAHVRAKLTRVAVAILDCPILAEEIVQEACLRLLLAKSGTIENPPFWLVTVTRNLALDYVKRRSRERQLLLLLKDLDPSELYDEQHATVSRLAEIISRLIDVSDSHITAILLLHVVFGVSYEDIATICGRTSAACRQAARRALYKCREATHTDNRWEENIETDMYVHAILDATMAPLIDSLGVTLPVSMQCQAEFNSPEFSTSSPATSARTRQILVLTATGVKWALILEGVVLCVFDNAEYSSIAVSTVRASSTNEGKAVELYD